MTWLALRAEVTVEFSALQQFDPRAQSFQFRRAPQWPVTLAHLPFDEQEAVYAQWRGVGRVPFRSVRVARACGLGYDECRGPRRYRAVVAIGMCPRCEAAPPAAGRRKCAPCAAYELAARNRYIAKMRAAVRCTACGRPAVPGQWRCERCRTKVRARQRK